jgi:hypothetical protein
MAIKGGANLPGFSVWTSWVSAAAPVVFLVVGTAATIAAPGFSSIESPISARADPTRPYPWIINTAFITYGLMVQGLGFTLYVSAHRLFAKVMLPALILLYGSGGIAAGIFVTGGADIVVFGFSEGDLHGVAASTTLLAIMMLMALGTFAQTLGGELAVMRKVSLALFALTAIAAIIFLIMPPELGLSGLLQRTFFGTTMAWVFMSSMHVANRQRHEP